MMRGGLAATTTVTVTSPCATPTGSVTCTFTPGGGPGPITLGPYPLSQATASFTVPTDSLPVGVYSIKVRRRYCRGGGVRGGGGVGWGGGGGYDSCRQTPFAASALDVCVLLTYLLARPCSVTTTQTRPILWPPTAPPSSTSSLQT